MCHRRCKSVQQESIKVGEPLVVRLICKFEQPQISEGTDEVRKRINLDIRDIWLRSEGGDNDGTRLLYYPI